MDKKNYKPAGSLPFGFEGRNAWRRDPALINDKGAEQ
jgi:hypothetical protein